MTDDLKEKEEIEAEETEEKEEKKQPKKPSAQEQIEALEKEVADLKDKYMRAAAEFENFRRRNISEKADWIKNANERIVLELCDVSDNFERALHSEGDKNQESYRKGIEMIFQQLSNILKKEGVEKIEAADQEFDPNFHEALAHIPSELEENKIVAVIQNGYLMNKKIIRAARVAVANGEKPATPAAEQNNKKKKK
ncbi:MAG TPA: nucleotide exchange factor GrpE [Candidatus Cloacimonadota bacterium]|nr:nucleotide exchange factor GrpE [Candidatus Cloacimonadota bacterium]